MEHIRTKLKAILEEIMFGAPYLREKAVQLYADVQVCYRWTDLYILADATQKLLDSITFEQKSEAV